MGGKRTRGPSVNLFKLRKEERKGEETTKRGFTNTAIGYHKKKPRTVAVAPKSVSGIFVFKCVVGLWVRKAKNDILYLYRKALILASELNRPRRTSPNERGAQLWAGVVSFWAFVLNIDIGALLRRCRPFGGSRFAGTRVETTTLNYTPIDYLSTGDSKSSPVPYR